MWTGTAHGLFGELGVGTVTHSALQLGLGLAGLAAGLGATLVLAGLGMAWVARGPSKGSGVPQKAESAQPEAITV